MSLLKTLGKGFGTAVRTLRVLAYVWPVNFVFALVVVSPVVFLIQRDFGHSLSGDIVGRLSFSWLGDVAYKYAVIAPALAGFILLWGLIYLIVSLFLNGGIIGRIAASGEKIRLSSFFADCGKYFWRFVRVFLLTLAAYALVLGVVMKLVALPFDAVVRGASGEWRALVASNLEFLLVILVLSVVSMFFDYMKIRLVAEDGKKVWRALLSTASLVGRNFFRAWGLYLLVGIFFLGLSLAFVAAGNRWISKWAIGGLGFAWAQLYVIFRLWIKVLFFGTEYQFYQAHKTGPRSGPAPAPAPAPLEKKEENQPVPGP